MAASRYPTSQYASGQLVESCGAVLLDLSLKPPRVCLIHYKKHDEWLLPKGRRNCGESRREAALREAQEETGYKCHIQPVMMSTRAPLPDDPENVPDRVRSVQNLDEPFMLTIQELGPDSGVKVIWWYVAAVDVGLEDGAGHGTGEFGADFFEYEEALQKLTYMTDREVLEKAIALVKDSGLGLS
ncbi:putative NUDIX domain [Aspergillus mulundensis]|uniref:Nudix hydrolase domain-containing protein n=1 Tax=Aspergillus mulundensis TaxID=1810919 RepID=A0A3D8RA59_9EURO|nr:Uncharacterized protein DSM5745_08426 [Aspergillus mulundensis]RDW70915.1 Uncharacterized protein DSM5745_08426 [Aspergillus mulundensis]